MDFVNFIGIDISKGTFDIALLKDSNEETLVTNAFANDPKGLVRLEEFLKKQSIDLDKTLFCMEHTGTYGLLFFAWLSQMGFDYCIEPELKIKRVLN